MTDGIKQVILNGVFLIFGIFLTHMLTKIIPLQSEKTTQNNGNGNQNNGSGNQNNGSGHQNNGSGHQNNGSGHQNNGSGNQNNTQVEVHTHSGMEFNGDITGNGHSFGNKGTINQYSSH